MDVFAIVCVCVYATTALFDLMNHLVHERVPPLSRVMFELVIAYINERLGQP